MFWTEQKAFNMCPNPLGWCSYMKTKLLHRLTYKDHKELNSMTFSMSFNDIKKSQLVNLIFLFMNENTQLLVNWHKNI